MAMAPGMAAPNAAASSAPVTTTVTVAGGGSGASDALALQQQAAAERAEVTMNMPLYCLLLCTLSAHFKDLTRYAHILSRMASAPGSSRSAGGAPADNIGNLFLA